MLYWVLTQNGYVISRTTVQRVTNLENELPENQETFSDFDEQIKGIIREDDFPLEGNKPDPADWDAFELLGTSEFDPICSFALSIVRRSGTPNSWQNTHSASPAFPFLYIVYIAAK